MAKQPKAAPLRGKQSRPALISTGTRVWPHSADSKVVVAKSVIQAVLAAHDSGTLEEANYDMHWPLSLAIELLEAAVTDMDAQEVARG